MEGVQTELMAKPRGSKEIKHDVKRYFRQDFQRLVLLSGKKISTLRSPQYDGMPKAPGVNGDFDSNLSKQADQQVIVDCTMEALNNITSISCAIVWRSLVMDEREAKIRRVIHYQHTRYSERKTAAMMEFYYAFLGRLAKRGISAPDLNFDEFLEWS